MDIKRIEQAISDLKHLSEYGEIFAYQNESIEIAIEALERQSKIDEAIKILQTVDWVGSGARARIQEAIELLT